MTGGLKDGQGDDGKGFPPIQAKFRGNEKLYSAK